MADRYAEWDAYRSERRSEPVPPEVVDAPAAETYSPAVVWASAMYAQDVPPGDLRPLPPAATPPPLEQDEPAGSKVRPALLGIASVIVVTTLIAAPVVARLTGWGSHDPSESGTRQPATGTSATPAAPGTTGPGCAGDAYQRAGFFVHGKAGWLSGSGGYSGAGCDGRFDALPTSGDAKKADPKLYAQWAFDPRSKHQCEATLYIPDKADRTYVGGSPAHYTVRQNKGGRKLLSFSIDQPRSRGRWVSSAVFTVDGPFHVRLTNTGTNPDKTFTHVVAAQARAACS